MDTPFIRKTAARRNSEATKPDRESPRFPRMPTVCRRVVPLLLAGALGCSSGTTPTGPVGPAPEYDFDPLTAAIQTALDTLPKADRAAVLLVQNGHVIYERGFGGLTVDDTLAIASASKSLTAAVVLALVDDRVVGLDVPMKRYLESVERGFWRDPRTHEITLRQMLSLTSGFGVQHPCIYRPLESLQDCAVAIGTFALAGDPGSVMAYGQSAFQVAGAVVEDASGRSWAELLERTLGTPLELEQTRYRGGDNPQLGDGAVSTVREYGRFLQMIHDGGVWRGRRILSRRLVEEMTRDQTGGVPIAYTPRPPSMRYGLGLWVESESASGEAIVLSSPGSLGFWPWIDRERNLVGVLAVPPHLSISGPIVPAVLSTVREIVPPGS